MSVETQVVLTTHDETGAYPFLQGRVETYAKSHPTGLIWIYTENFSNSERFQVSANLANNSSWPFSVALAVYDGMKQTPIPSGPDETNQEVYEGLVNWAHEVSSDQKRVAQLRRDRELLLQKTQLQPMDAAYDALFFQLRDASGNSRLRLVGEHDTVQYANFYCDAQLAHTMKLFESGSFREAKRVFQEFGTDQTAATISRENTMVDQLHALADDPETAGVFSVLGSAHSYVSHATTSKLIFFPEKSPADDHAGSKLKKFPGFLNKMRKLLQQNQQHPYQLNTFEAKHNSVRWEFPLPTALLRKLYFKTRRSEMLRPTPALLAAIPDIEWEQALLRLFIRAKLTHVFAKWNDRKDHRRVADDIIRQYFGDEEQIKRLQEQAHRRNSTIAAVIHTLLHPQ